MSLQNLATQMAAQGRGPDRTLVHMSPKEVQGLQALAMAHGGSLTINPQTGLPEAGFLESILPAVAGFALNAFAPGVGTAVGGMLGLGEAAGTALTVGGIAGLASGSLEKGIMAGMGAYGGAGLAGSLMNSGTSALTKAGVDAAGGAAALGGDASGIAQKVADTSTLDKLKSGFSAAASTPKDFLSDNKFAIGAALLPAIAGGLNDKGEGTGATKTPKYIRRYETDPVTGEIRQAQAISTDDFGDQPAVSFGGVPARGMADGGPVTFGGVPASTKVIDPYDTRTDSQKSLDYLMGKGANPMLFTHKTSTGPIKPADFDSRTGGKYILDSATNAYVWVPDDTAAADAAAASLAAKEGLAALDRRGGGGKGDGESSNPGWDAKTDTEKAAYYAENPTMGKITQFGQNLFGYTILGALQKALDPAFVSNQSLIARGIDPNNIGPLGGVLGTDTGAVPTDSGWGRRDAGGITTAVPLGNEPLSAPPTASGKPGETPVGGTGYGFTGPTNNATDGGWGSRDAGGGGTGQGGLGEGSGGGRYAAAGGLMEARYASGGLGSLGGYSDGGQLLRGPGNGVSDSIPARIAGNQPARLADGEFVVPARIVSELGNGSTDAGARELYKMMARIQAGRAKTVGKNKTAVNSKSARHLPA